MREWKGSGLLGLLCGLTKTKRQNVSVYVFNKTFSINHLFRKTNLYIRNVAIIRKPYYVRSGSIIIFFKCLTCVLYYQSWCRSEMFCILKIKIPCNNKIFFTWVAPLLDPYCREITLCPARNCSSLKFRTFLSASFGPIALKPKAFAWKYIQSSKHFL